MGAGWVALALGCVGGPSESGGPSPAGEGTPIERVAEAPPVPWREVDRPDLAGGAPADAPPPDFPYDAGSVHFFRLEIDEEARASLAAEPNVSVHATFAYGDRKWDVGLELKGGASLRTLDGKPSFKIDFHEWDEEARFFGIKRLVLNNMVQDRTMLREGAYYWLCGQLGIPAPRSGYARVWVDGEEYGLYALIEEMDEQFVDRVWRYDDGGVLLEASGDDFVAPFDHFYAKEEGEGDIDALVATVADTPVDETLELLVEHFDEEALFAYWALDAVGGNRDGYTFNHHNYHLYYAPRMQRWTMIPWGTDLAFSMEDAPVHGSATHPILGALVDRCLRDADCLRVYDDAVLAMADAWEDRDLVGYVEAATARIAEAAEADPRRETAWEPEDILAFAREAPGNVRAQLGE